MVKVLKDYYLTAESKRNAFYKIGLYQDNEFYLVRKESGSNGKVADIRDWTFPELSEAEKFLERKVREKTNPEGKRERKYKMLT